MTKNKRNALIAAIISVAVSVGYQFLPPQYQVILSTIRAIVSETPAPEPEVYPIPDPDPLAPNQ